MPVRAPDAHPHTRPQWREGRAGSARPHSLGFLAPSLPAGSWCTSTPAAPRSSTTRRPRVQHIWRITSVLGSSALRRPAARGKSQSCGSQGSAAGGSDVGTRLDSERAPPRDLLRGLRSIAAFLGLTAAPRLFRDGAPPGRDAGEGNGQELRVSTPPDVAMRSRRADCAAASRNRACPYSTPTQRPAFLRAVWGRSRPVK